MKSVCIILALCTTAVVLSGCDLGHICNFNLVEVHGQTADTVSKAPCSNREHTIDFISARAYLPDGDDDFGFAIFPSIPVPGNEPTYGINGFSADNSAVARLFLTRIALPDYVRVGHRSTHKLTMADASIPSYTIPAGFNGMPLVELLAYAPASDDDFEYTINPLWDGSTVDFVTRLERGNSNSQVTVRVTVLEWPEDKAVSVIADSSLIVENNSSRSVVLPDWQKFTLVTPTGYNTRGDDDFWYRMEVSREEKEEEEEDLRLNVTTGGGGQNSNLLVNVWSVAFPE